MTVTQFNVEENIIIPYMTGGGWQVDIAYKEIAKGETLTVSTKQTSSCVILDLGFSIQTSCGFSHPMILFDTLGRLIACGAIKQV